jgi:hypothetical protein
MWQFEQLTGKLSKDGILVSPDCYSGRWPDGYNNPAMEAVPDVGPIPCGLWTIGAPYEDGKLGRYVMDLTPAKGTVTYGRSLFRMHGKPLPPADIRSGSEGCICADYVTRQRVYQSADTQLTVVPGETPNEPQQPV